MSYFTASVTLTPGSPSAPLYTPTGWAGISVPSLQYTPPSGGNDNGIGLLLSDGSNIVVIEKPGLLLSGAVNVIPVVWNGPSLYERATGLLIFNSGSHIVASTTNLVGGDSLVVSVWGRDQPQATWVVS